MHKQRIKAILSMLTEQSHFWLQTCALRYALKLKSEKCSVNDPKLLKIQVLYRKRTPYT